VVAYFEHYSSLDSVRPCCIFLFFHHASELCIGRASPQAKAQRAYLYGSSSTRVWLLNLWLHSEYHRDHIGFVICDPWRPSVKLKVSTGQPSFIAYFDLATRSNGTDLISTMNGLFQTGGVIGTLLLPTVADKYGRKWACAVVWSCDPLFLCHLLTRAPVSHPCYRLWCHYGRVCQRRHVHRL
jgi:hypothetical protein